MRVPRSASARGRQSSGAVMQIRRIALPNAYQGHLALRVLPAPAESIRDEGNDACQDPPPPSRPQPMRGPRRRGEERISASK
jgi:hypothetical protein